MANKKKKSGALEFTAHNGIVFIVDRDADSDSDDNHEIRWDEDPVKFAAALRKAADWLDQHVSDKIVVEVD